MKSAEMIEKLCEALKAGTVDIQTDGRSQLVIYTGWFEDEHGNHHDGELPKGIKGIDD